MSSRIWRFAEFEFHEREHELRQGGSAVPLESKPRDVLQFLLASAGAVVSQEDIKQAVWGSQFVSAPTVPVALKKLRDAFGHTNRDQIVRTVKGQGYILAVEVFLVEGDRKVLHLTAGQPVPGRPGWILVQLLHSDPQRSRWITEQLHGLQRRMVEVAWTREGLAILSAEADVLREVHLEQPGIDSFPNLMEFQNEVVPYVLELQDGGLDLPQWAAKRGGLQEIDESVRINIVAQVATALEVLHRAGHVHGDLCPEYIFIEEGSLKPKVRLLCPGLYMPESPASTTHRLLSHGTPAQPAMYRAPELDAQLATPLGDIYTLGVLLYQVIVGTLLEPPGPGWENRVGDSVLRLDIALTANVMSARRMPDVSKVATRLNDLSRRRQVAEELSSSRLQAEVAQRQLAAELAKAPLRRALVGAFVLLMLSLLSITTLSMVNLRKARERASAERQDTAVLDGFLRQLFFDGGVAARGPVSTEDLLRRGLKKADYLRARPAVHAALLGTLGSGFDTMGDYSEAERSLGEALEERIRLFGSSSPEVASTLVLQSALKEDENQPEEALRLAQHALTLQQHAFPQGNIEVLRTKTRMAEALNGLGKYMQAVSLLEEVILQEEGRPDLLPELSDALNDLGIDRNYLGDVPGSIRAQQRSMEIDRALEGDNHPDIAEHLLSLSNAHDLLGMYGPAATEARQALSILSEWLPPGHHEVAAAHAHLGTELSHLPGLTQEAQHELETSLHVLRKEPERSSTEAYAETALGGVLLEQQRNPAALAAYGRSLQLYKRSYPLPHVMWISSLNGCSATLQQEGQWIASIQSAAQAVAIAVKNLPADDAKRLRSELLLAYAREHENRKQDAILLLEEILAHSGPENTAAIKTHDAALSELGRLEVAPQRTTGILSN